MGKSVEGREFGAGIEETPEPIELYHEIKNKIEEKQQQQKQ